MMSGAMLVDDDGDAVFCLAREPTSFLRALAGWATRHIAAIPALGALQTSGAAKLPEPLGTDATIAALNLETLDVNRDPAIWPALLPTDDASVAAILADRLPGERMWFWVSNEVPADMVPLLLQPVAWDPNRDRLDSQIRQLETAGAGAGVSGYAYTTEAGRIQFVSDGLRHSLMVELADWVHQQVTACPALGRLADCQFVRVRAGQVLEVLEYPELWSDIAAPPVPGTLATAAAALAALLPDESLRLWLTAQAPGGGFVALAPVAGDEQGTGFQAQVAAFYRRFPESYQDAAIGTLTRVHDGSLRVAWHVQEPIAATRGLVSIARREGGLRPLAEAVLETKAA